VSGLPNDWATTSIGELTQGIQYGFTASASTEHSSPKFLRITDLNNGAVDWNTVPGCIISKKEFDKFRLRDGDLVFARTGSIEKAARITSPPPAVFASYLLRGSPLFPELGGWLEKFTLTLDYLRQIGAAGAGTGRQNVNATNLALVQVPLPPLAEQRRIVAKLEVLMSRSRKSREALGQIPGFLELYRQSVLSAALRGDLTKQWRSQQKGKALNARDQLQSIQQDRQKRWHRRGGLPVLPTLDSSNLSSLPENWVWSRVEEVGEVRLGRQRAPKHHQGPNMRSYLRVQNVFEDRLDLSDVMTMNFDPEEAITFNLVPGDLLLNEGQSLELVGRPAMYRGELPGVCFTNTLIRFRAYQGVLPEYALLVFRTYLRTGRFQEIASWSTNIAHLGADRFAKMEFPLPALAEQAEIVRKTKILLEAADRLGSFAAEGMKAAVTLDQAILGKAFCGELVPQDPNDEPAEILLARLRAEREASSASTRRSLGVPITTRPQPPSRAAGPAMAPEPPPVPRPTANRPKADDLDADTGLPAFRQALTAQARWNSDDDLLRAVAQRLGYERLGSSVKEALRGHLRAALLRRIVERQEDGTLVVGPRTLDAYTRDELIDAIPSVMRKGLAIDRDELMRAILHHFAFQRLTDPAHDALKSALNSAIRRGVLEASGPGRVRRIV